MNEHYLIKYISYHLHTIVRRYDINGTLLESYCARISFHDCFEDDEIFRVFAGTALPSGKKDIPVILSAEDELVYALIRTGSRYTLIGPVRMTTPVDFLHTYPGVIPLPDISVRPVTKQWLLSVYACEYDTFSKDILLVHNLFHEKEITEEMLNLENSVDTKTDEKLRESFSQLVFTNREYGKVHNPYDQELREFSSIESGDLAQLERSLSEDYPGEVGTLSEDPLRHAKNRGIVVVTLASRAAMRGGVVPEEAYSLSDSYIQKIEKCRDIPAVFHLFYAAEYEYTRMVKELKEQKEGTLEKDKNPHINKCKDYIFSHLHGRISVQEIADALGLNAAYLSELFHDCEKVTLTEYIRREKINLAKNLLIYSRYSYSEISTYLGFSSQSHLGKYFKSSTGMTMRQYRNVYGMKEFDA